MTERPHSGLPIPAYRDQGDDAIATVRKMKQSEERLLRALDEMVGDPAFDQRWLAIGRTQIEQGFMAVNRSVFKPARVRLVE